MTSPRAATALLRSAWATIGLPLSDPPLDERVAGLIDLEALLLSTLLIPKVMDARLAENLLPFTQVYERLIHYERLRALLLLFPLHHATNIRSGAATVGLDMGVKRLTSALGINPRVSSSPLQTSSRRGRIRKPEDTAQLSAFISARLLYGTGYRADIVALTSIRQHKWSGRELSRLLGTTPSTVSRILADLKACRFLDARGQQKPTSDEFAGLCISSDSLRNLVILIDASQMDDPLLARAIREDCDFEWDILGRTLEMASQKKV